MDQGLDSTHRMGTPEVIERIKAIAGRSGDGPVMMLNINRYTDAAAFPEGAAYSRYMTHLGAAVGQVGGAVLWRTSVSAQVIGCEHENYDELLAVWYPSRTAFLELAAAADAPAMFDGRKLCVEHATILELPADSAPFAR